MPKGRPRAAIAGKWSRWRPHRFLSQLKSLLIDLSMMVQANSPAEEIKALLISKADVLYALDDLPESYPKTYVYTPEKTRDFERMVKLQAQQLQTEKLTGELTVEILVSFNKKTFGDVDNYSKAILDALQKARVFENDKQIAQLNIKREYNPGNPEFAKITIREITKTDKST